MRKLILIPVSLVLVMALSLAAQSPSGSSRVVTTSRLVVVYAGLENEFNNALQKNDLPAIDRLLSEDFEVWTPVPGAYPIAREDWLPKNSGANAVPAKMRQWAVKDMGNSRVVSFIQTRANGEAFVVDIWRDAGNDSWKLTDRYMSEIRR